MNTRRTYLLPLLGAALLTRAPSHAETAAESLMLATLKVFNQDSTSAGFLVRDTAADAVRTKVILVTAAHTFCKAKGDVVLLVCRVKNAQDDWERYDHKVAIRQGTNALWTCHPSQDVAVIRCDLPAKAVFDALPPEALADEATAVGAGLTVGSRLSFFSYPHQVEANNAGFPLYREGLVSGYPLFPARRYPQFLFSANTFAGDSGAAVALMRGDTQPPLVVGLVVARTQHNDTLKSPDMEMTVKRDLGIGSILHAAYIRETLALLR